MISDFLNPGILWEYDVHQLDPDQWATFIVKQVFNRPVHQQLTAIPALLDYYGKERVESMLREEEWLTSDGIQTAQQYFPTLRKRDFKATPRINRRKRQLAAAGEVNPKL